MISPVNPVCDKRRHLRYPALLNNLLNLNTVINSKHSRMGSVPGASVRSEAEDEDKKELILSPEFDR